jgi:hypothetical protein
MESINSYPSVMQLGHKMIADIFSGEVLIEEKIDGSQFSFGVINGELTCRSKGKQLLLDAPEKMFERAVEFVKTLSGILVEGWVYRGEYLEKPKHNTLTYSRIPQNHIIIFDIQMGLENYLSVPNKVAEAHRIGLECAPALFEGIVTDFDMFKSFLERESVLGGTKIEGVVVKNYNLFTAEKKVAMGKYVSEAFKETNQKDWKSRNPSGKDFEAILIEKYRTDARWQKAIQHLRESGQLTDSPQDIGLLIKEVPADILKECGEEIKEALFSHFWKNIARGVTRGLPEWYKEELAKKSFDNNQEK